MPQIRGDSCPPPESRGSCGPRLGGNIVTPRESMKNVVETTADFESPVQKIIPHPSMVIQWPLINWLEISIK